MNPKLLILLATGALFAIAPPAFSQSQAQARPMHCRARAAVPYSLYQNPDGTYDLEADFSRDLWGVPCGINCTRAAHERWARWFHENCAG